MASDGGKGGGKPGTDWEGIEKEYRIGQLTVREIARRYNIAHSSITRRAEKNGWVRDLTDEIRAKTHAALLRTTSDAPPERTTPSREEIGVAVQTNVALVVSHRTDIRENRSAVTKLISELHSTIESIDEIEAAIEDETAGDKDGRRRARMMAAVALPSRAAIANALAQALKTLIPLERQAFNIDDKGAPPDGSDGNPVNVIIDASSAERLKRLVE